MGIIIVLFAVAVAVLYHDVLVLVARVNELEAEVHGRPSTGTIGKELPGER